MTALTIHPATPDLWPAIEDLFGPKGACNNCWCMYWRIGAQYRRNPPAKNKSAFKSIVRQGPPPGLLAFEGDLPVGWCQLTPRKDLAWLERTWGPKDNRRNSRLVHLLSLHSQRPPQKRHHHRSDLRSNPSRKKSERSCPRSLSTRREKIPQRHWHGLRLHIRTRWIQNRRSPNSTPAHHAHRLKITTTLPNIFSTCDTAQMFGLAHFA